MKSASAPSLLAGVGDNHGGLAGFFLKKFAKGRTARRTYVQTRHPNDIVPWTMIIQTIVFGRINKNTDAADGAVTTSPLNCPTEVSRRRPILNKIRAW